MVKASPQKIWRWTHIHLTVFVLLISMLLTLFLGGALYLFIALNIPDIRSIASYQPPATTVIYDDQDTAVARIFKQNRTVVPLAELPPLLPQAFVAAEDDRFYQHGGVDAWSILRALIHNIRTGERGQGGSTITQQVARSLLLTPKKTYTRKLKEAILAYRIDKALSKDEILHIYLNQIYLGSGAYGVETAAQTYFGKHVRDLNLAEISLLAGLPQAPSRYSPFKHYKLAKKRQAYVLNRMAEEGYITPTAARKAYKQPLLWVPAPEYRQANNYFIQQIKNYVENKYGSDRLMTGGLRIYTTLDQALQKAASLAVKRGIAKWAIRQQGVTPDTIPPEAALVALEVRSGMVRAVVGGTDFSRSQYNRAIQARRQPGSAFKPIIYAAALSKGMTPATMIMDEPLHLQGSTPGDVWEPQNFSGKFFGLTSLRNGLVHSRNIVTIKLLQETGIPAAIKLARQLGIDSPLADNLSLALGSSDVSVLELANAYRVFANHGVYQKPIFIKKILDKNGAVLEENKSSPRPVLDKRLAYQVTRLLEGVIEEGTGKSVRGLGMPAAGKTGTSDQNMDAWFIGYTPELVCGVWVGHDQKISLGPGETGGRAAAPIWLDFMQATKDSYPAVDFEAPTGIILVPIDNQTGRPESQYSDTVSWEAFRKDTLPWDETSIPRNAPRFVSP